MRLGGHLSSENPTRQLNPPLPVVLFQSNTEEASRRRFHRRGGGPPGPTSAGVRHLAQSNAAMQRGPRLDCSAGWFAGDDGGQNGRERWCLPPRITAVTDSYWSGRGGGKTSPGDGLSQCFSSVLRCRAVASGNKCAQGYGI